MKTGATNGEDVEIVSGIAEGDQVITSIRRGARMNIAVQQKPLITFDKVWKTYGRGE